MKNLKKINKKYSKIERSERCELTFYLPLMFCQQTNISFMINESQEPKKFIKKCRAWFFNCLCFFGHKYTITKSDTVRADKAHTRQVILQVKVVVKMKHFSHTNPCHLWIILQKPFQFLYFFLKVPNKSWIEPDEVAFKTVFKNWTLMKRVAAQ